MLLLLGCVCIIAGLGISFIEGYASQKYLLLTAVGALCLLVVCVVLDRGLRGSRKQSLWHKWLYSVLIFVLLATVYVEVNYLGYFYNVRFDVTKQKQHTLSDSTIDFLAELTQDVKLTVLHVGIAPKYVEDILSEFKRHSKGRVATEVIDPLVDIGYAAQFDTVITGKEQRLIVQAANERRDVDFSEEPLTEEDIFNAILRVTREARHVYFLSGHGEREIFEENEKGFNTFTKKLLANNIIPKELFLGVTKKIPEDCDVLVVVGPSEPLDELEITLIRDYLAQGGDAFFLVEHTFVSTSDKPIRDEDLHRNPSLNEIVEDWGITIEEDVVIDLASNVGDPGSPATKNYLTHRAIVGGLDYTFYVRPRSISMKKDRRKTIKLAPLVLTASEKQSWAEKNRFIDQIKFTEGEDRAGPVPLAFVIFEPQIEEKLSETRIVVFTDADFLSNAFIDSYSNAQMGLKSISWLTELDFKVFDNKSDIEVEQLNLTSQQKRMVVLVLLLMPIIVLLIGLSVWIKSLKRS